VFSCCGQEDDGLWTDWQERSGWARWQTVSVKIIRLALVWFLTITAVLLSSGHHSLFFSLPLHNIWYIRPLRLFNNDYIGRSTFHYYNNIIYIIILYLQHHCAALLWSMTYVFTIYTVHGGGGTKYWRHYNVILICAT